MRTSVRLSNAVCSAEERGHLVVVSGGGSGKRGPEQEVATGSEFAMHMQARDEWIWASETP